MNYEALAEQFWEQGYVVVEDMFDAATMDRYQALILEHFGDSPAFCHNEEFITRSATEVIPWFPQKEGLTEFDSVQDDLRLRALTLAILGEGWRTLYCMTMFSSRGSKGQAWHQDCAPEDPAVFNVNRLIYTEDITPEIGWRSHHERAHSSSCMDTPGTGCCRSRGGTGYQRTIVARHLARPMTSPTSAYTATCVTVLKPTR